MAPRTRAIVLRPRHPLSPLAALGELRLGRLLADIAALDAEIAARTAAVAAFEAAYHAATAAAFAELEAAERLARRLRRLQDDLARLGEALREPPPRRRAAQPSSARRVTTPHAGRSVGAPPRAAAAAPAPAEPAARGLKTLYRRLARRLHPDLAPGDDAERARLSALMARANDAYERGDGEALLLLAEQVGAVQADAATDAALEAQLRARVARLEGIRSRRAAERDRLAASPSGRLAGEAAERDAAGGDFLAEARAAAEERARSLEAEALERLDVLGAAAHALARSVPAAARRPRARPSPTALARRPARAGDARATPAGRALGRWLEEAAAAPEPWPATLTLIAALAELAGSPPATCASARLLSERWDALRAAWPGAPALGGALARAPRHLEVGLRAHADDLHAGVQLADPALLAGVRTVLGREPVAELARSALAALGPRERCARCDRDVYAVHLLRLRGLDEVHALACPGCGATLRHFWRYGEPEGLEALAGVALEVGLAVEQRVRLGDVVLAFQLLPAERARLTARSLVRRFRELSLAPHGLELPRDAIAVRAGRVPLAAGARVPERGPIALAVTPGAGLSERELVSRIRERVHRRFRVA